MLSLKPDIMHVTVHNKHTKLVVLLMFKGSTLVIHNDPLQWLNLNSLGSILQCTAGSKAAQLPGSLQGEAINHTATLDPREPTVSMVLPWPPSITHWNTCRTDMKIWQMHAGTVVVIQQNDSYWKVSGILKRNKAEMSSRQNNCRLKCQVIVTTLHVPTGCRTSTQLVKGHLLLAGRPYVQAWRTVGVSWGMCWRRCIYVCATTIKSFS